MIMLKNVFIYNSNIIFSIFSTGIIYLIDLLRSINFLSNNIVAIICMNVFGLIICNNFNRSSCSSKISFGLRSSPSFVELKYIIKQIFFLRVEVTGHFTGN